MQDPINRFKSAILFACSKSGPRFPTYAVVFFVFDDLKSQVFVRFVDIGEIIDHHCLHVLIIILNIVHCVFMLQ